MSEGRRQPPRVTGIRRLAPDLSPSDPERAVNNATVTPATTSGRPPPPSSYKYSTQIRPAILLRLNSGRTVEGLPSTLSGLTGRPLAAVKSNKADVPHCRSDVSRLVSASAAQVGPKVQLQYPITGLAL